MTVPVLPRAVALLLLALLLVACGGEQSPDEATGDDPAEADDTDDDAATEADDPEDEADTGDDAEATADGNPEGCVDDPEEGVDYFPHKASFAHAEAADVSYHDTYKTLEVSVPFGEEPVRFVLVQCGFDPPALDGDLAEATVIEVPVSEVVTTTTTNLPHFDALSAVDRLAGVGNPAFVTTESVADAVEAGEVEGFADAEGSPDVERVIAAEPDALILDAFGETVLDTVDRLADAGVPSLLNADFVETTLLGRAEWVKVTALLLNTEAEAEERFAEIAERYEETAALVADTDERPEVLHGEPFEGTWFAPGGQSVTARAIEEAGGRYVFADEESPESVPFDLETVLDQGSGADVWIHAGSVHGTLDDLLSSDERFASIQAFSDGEVWAHDAAADPEGGNPLYERAYLRADEYLADLVAMFHPDLIDHDPVYFGRVPGN